MNKLLVLLLAVVPLLSYGQKDVQKRFQTLFIDAEDGTEIQLPAGKFYLEATLSLDGKSNLKIKGAGKDKTILSFAGQVAGAEGIRITDGNNIVIQDLRIEDTKGDGVKAQLVAGMTFNNVVVSWTGGPDEKNGGYGLYPVQCSDVLIDRCEVSGASDAGIYVGQSKNIIVRNSKAYHNVAGIEIENSMYADVHDNDTYQNTGGILIFDLPDLEVKEGGFVRVFKNNIHDNNHDNFAPKGNIVAKVPLGTGLMILATRNVEVFENKIVNNISAGTAIISYYMTENPITDPLYKPFPAEIYIHDNFFERPRVRATGKGRMGKMYRFKLRFGKDVPHVIYDGIEDPGMSQRNICLANNENISVANLDAGNSFKNKSRDMTPFNCQGKSIQPVQLRISKI